MLRRSLPHRFRLRMRSILLHFVRMKTISCEDDITIW